MSSEDPTQKIPNGPSFETRACISSQHHSSSFEKGVTVVQQQSQLVKEAVNNPTQDMLFCLEN